MATNTSQLTAEQLAALPDDGQRCELVAGELIMMSPAGGRQGHVAFKLGWMLANHVNPAHDTVHVYRSQREIVVLSNDDELDANDVIPGWKIRLAELFTHA